MTLSEEFSYWKINWQYGFYPEQVCNEEVGKLRSSPPSVISENK